MTNEAFIKQIARQAPATMQHGPFQKLLSAQKAAFMANELLTASPNAAYLGMRGWASAPGHRPLPQVIQFLERLKQATDVAGALEALLIHRMSILSPQAVRLLLDRLVACQVLQAATHQPGRPIQAAGPPSFLRCPTRVTPAKVTMHSARRDATTIVFFQGLFVLCSGSVNHMEFPTMRSWKASHCLRDSCRDVLHCNSCPLIQAGSLICPSKSASCLACTQGCTLGTEKAKQPALAKSDSQVLLGYQCRCKLLVQDQAILSDCLSVCSLSCR